MTDRADKRLHPAAAVIDIIELVMPGDSRILPGEDSITVHNISTCGDLVTVTLTIRARRINFRSETDPT